MKDQNTIDQMIDTAIEQLVVLGKPHTDYDVCKSVVADNPMLENVYGLYDMITSRQIKRFDPDYWAHCGKLEATQ